MKTPVIITAHNEEAYIGRTLRKLDAAHVEPIVAVNGSTDRTAEVAESFGVQVYDLDRQGKLPAIQHALKRLGSRALEPALYTDADSYPESTEQWVRHMAHGLPTDRPSAAAGLLRFIDGNPLYDVARTYRRRQEMETAVAASRVRFWGANMATALFNDQVLDYVLDLPNRWPGEDVAIEDAVILHGGISQQILEKAARVKTSSRSFASLTTRIFKGSDVAFEEHMQHYIDTAPADSTPYQSILNN